MVEFDPAVPASPDAEVQPAPVAEHDAQAPDATCAAHAHVAEYDVPAPNMAYLVHAAPLPWLSMTLHRMWRARHMRHLLPWLNATLQHRPEVTPAPTMAYRVPEELVEDLFTAMMDKFIEKLDEPYEPEDNESVCGK